MGLYYKQRGCGSALDFGMINGIRGCREMQLSYYTFTSGWALS